MTWLLFSIIAIAYLAGGLAGFGCAWLIMRSRVRRIVREQKRIDERHDDIARRIEHARQLAIRASRQADQALAYVAQHRGELQ